MADADQDGASSPSAQANETRQPVTLVTGGTEGIGLALAREFARHGHDLLLIARSQEKLDRAAENLARAFGVRVRRISADLATPEGCEAVSATVEEDGLYVDYLVNNAAYGVEGPFAEIDAERLLGMVDLNLRAVTDLTRRFLPGMIERGAGGVLNLGSLAGFAPGPYQQVYYASKAYIISLSQAIAYEVHETGVRVAVVTPGPVATEFHTRMGSENAYYMRFGMMQADAVARIAYARFMRGQRVIAPGIVNMINHVLLRLMPRALLVPFMGFLLKQRVNPSHAETSRRRDS